MSEAVLTGDRCEFGTEQGDTALLAQPIPSHPTPLPLTPPTTGGTKTSQPELIFSISAFSGYRGSQSEFELTTDLVCNKIGLKGSSPQP